MSPALVSALIGLNFHQALFRDEGEGIQWVLVPNAAQSVLEEALIGRCGS